MANVQTKHLIESNLKPENEAKLNQVLNGPHNEFDENSIGKINFLRDDIVGNIRGTNYIGRFWQAQGTFGISIENNDTHINYQCKKDGVEVITITRLVDENWSKTLIKKEDDNTYSATTETIDPATFISIVGSNTSSMGMRDYENTMEEAEKEIPKTVAEGKTVTKSKIESQSMLEMFNILIINPEQYSNSSYRKN